MPKKKTTKADEKQPSLYGEVDELYNLLSAHESADNAALEAAKKRVTSAREHQTEMEAQLFNTRKAMKIVERRRDELRPKPLKVEKKGAAGAKGRIEGKRPKPEGKPPKATKAPPKADDKKTPN